MKFIQAAVDSDLGVHFHAIGDRCSHRHRRHRGGYQDTPSTNRHSIAHAQLVDPGDIARIAALKIPVAFTYAWAVRDYGYDVTVIPSSTKSARCRTCTTRKITICGKPIRPDQSSRLAACWPPARRAGRHRRSAAVSQHRKAVTWTRVRPDECR